MKKFMAYLKKEWKLVTTVIGVLSIMISLGTIDARYAKTAEVKELDQKKTTEIKQVKTEVAETITELKKNIQLQRDIMRLESVSDQIIKTKLLLKTYPKDKDLKEDYETLKQQKEKLQEKIDSSAQEKTK